MSTGGGPSSGSGNCADFANFVINDLDTAMQNGRTSAREQLVAKASAYLDGLAKKAAG